MTKRLNSGLLDIVAAFLRMCKSTIVLLTGWILSSTTFLFAQAPNLSFEHLSVKDGLPGSAVYSIAKDKQGFMWFGTRRCPARYDGATFRPFLFPETYMVSGMVADSANRVWMTTDRAGLCRIDPNTLRLSRIANTPQSTGYLYVDSEGYGWFSDGTGVNCINLKTGHYRHYNFRQTSYLGQKAYGFLEDKQRRLWVIGSDNGLFRFDRKTRRFTCVLGLDCSDPTRRKQYYLNRGCVDSDGIFWIGSYGDGLLRVNPETGAYAILKTGEGRNWITCAQEGTDENGQKVIWVGDDQGLLAYRPEQQRFYRVSLALTGKESGDPLYVYTIYRDSASGILWVGTSDGILKFNPQDNLIRTVSLPPALIRRPVTINVITADRQDLTGQTFWLGLSHTGLLRWHRPTNQFTLIQYPNNKPETMWIAQPGNGLLWIGLRRWDYAGDGVLVYDTQRNRFVTEPAAQRAGKLFSVPFVDNGLIDQQQRLWVGNNDEGIRVLDIRTGQPLTYWPEAVVKELHRNNNFLTDIHIDKTGRVWLATYKGLYLADIKKHRFRLVDVHNQPEDLAANSLLVSRNGHVWAARWGSITETLPNGQLQTVLTAKHGLYDRENRRLAEDQNGTIWAGNFEGLHGYNPRTHQLVRLTVSDGLSRNNTMASLYMHQGYQLFIGQQNGLNYLDVRQLQHTMARPPVVVSSFRVHERERPFDITQPVQLNPSERAFSVDFSVLTYSRLRIPHYAYFLDGMDDHWIYSDTAQRELNSRAYYTNLKPGHYTLNLKAADSFGNWSPKPVQIAIDVLPAFYETWWFRTIVVLLAVSILYGLYQYRVNQLLRVEHIRNRISADLHDEIGSSLSGISILGTMAKNTIPAEHPSGSLMERIIAEARQISTSLDDIVWSINPRNDELSSLIARMNRYAAELFEASGIAYHIRVPESIQDLTLSMEKRRDFYLVFKEAVNNLVKHADATQATITISLEHNYLCLEVVDNGVGFNTESDTERNGLRNMQARTQSLNGKLAIYTVPMQGTTLRLEFPVTT